MTAPDRPTPATPRPDPYATATPTGSRLARKWVPRGYLLMEDILAIEAEARQQVVEYLKAANEGLELNGIDEVLHDEGSPDADEDKSRG